MRPSLVAWLVAHGLPGWIAPDYFTLVAASTILGAMWVLAWARRDGVTVHEEARTLVLIYVAALVGGYLFESLRMLPEAIAERSIAPMTHVGRAAYGGLLGAMLVAVLHLRRRGEPLGGLFDRVSVPAGLVFAAVRTGCFLAGCDYGLPTSSPLGVRFPGGSLPSVEHAAMGWVPVGAPSLPVHATQLYEAGVALLASAIAWRIFRRGARDGGAFIAWLATYSLGRVAVEQLRGDASRGGALGLSSAQWVSLALLTLCGSLVLSRLRAQRRAEGYDPSTLRRSVSRAS